MTASGQVLWIGGPSGAGKSTVARLLTRRHGLRWYSCDTRTWEHRDRALAAGDPDAVEWERLTPEQRSQLPAADQIRLSLDRTAMVVADVAALPDKPAVIAEGTPVRPSMVPLGGCAFWLVADTSTRSTRNHQRGWGGAGGEAELIKNRALQEELRRHDATVIDTTADHDVLATVRRLEEHAADWIDRQPRAGARIERRKLIRAGNAAIIHQYRSGMARAGNSSADANVRAYDCECADPGCVAFVQRTLSTLPYPYLGSAELILAPGHH